MDSISTSYCLTPSPLLQTLQRAFLHVLERAQRWKEAYNYCIYVCTYVYWY